MKYLFTLLCFYSSFLIAQTKQQMPTNVYGGNNQFGNNNTQNNNFQPRLDNKNKEALMKFIYELELDSNFHHTKYFKMSFERGSNGMQVLLDIISFLKGKGYIDINNGAYYTQWHERMPMGVQIELSKKDSTLNILVGQVE